MILASKPPAPPVDTQLPPQLPPERLGRLVTILALARGILWDHLCGHDDLINLRKNVSAYPLPTPTGWYLLPEILDGGVFVDEEFDKGWSEWRGRHLGSRSPVGDAPGVDAPEGDGEHEGETHQGWIFRPYGETKSWWRRRSEFSSLADRQFVTFASQEEARPFRASCVATVDEAAATVTPAVFDWLAYHYPLDDKRNLFYRLSELVDGIERATDRAAASACEKLYDSLLRDFERLADREDVKEWHEGRDSEEEGAQYWIDRKRHDAEVQANRDAQRRRVAEYDLACDVECGLRYPDGRWRNPFGNEDDPPGDGPGPRAPDGGGPPQAGQSKQNGPELGSTEPRASVLLRIPGFVSEFMCVCLESAPYPNEMLAFAGALAMLAFLVARKVTDAAGTCPNLFLLALAQSGAGKDHPRKVCKKLSREVGMSECLAESIASAQGLEDALQVRPSMLFMLDEADALLRAMVGEKDPRLIEIHRALLTLYSASSSTYTVRIKAGAPGATIDQPHVTCLWTAIPQHFFAALTERMLTNGLAGRMFLVDATGPRVGQRPKVVRLSTPIIEAAAYWRDFLPAGNDLHVAHPSPQVIPSDPEAEALLDACRVECDRRYNAAESEAERTIHARTYEKARKVALLYAVSGEARGDARITTEAARFAVDFARQQAADMLALITRHGATSPFEQRCRRVLELLRTAPGRRLMHSDLLKRLHVSAKEMAETVRALLEREEIELKQEPTRGRVALFYCLA